MFEFLSNFIDIVLNFIFRNPDLTLTHGENDQKHIYLRRWWLIPKNKYFNIYLHQFKSSDEDRALHDHPWKSLSIILNRPYLEHLPLDKDNWISNKDRREIIKKRYPIIPIFRESNNIHRIELIGSVDNIKPVWTIFMTGPKVHEWGFWCPKGWKHHTDFLNKDGNAKGVGCDED